MRSEGRTQRGRKGGREGGGEREGERRGRGKGEGGAGRGGEGNEIILGTTIPKSFLFSSHLQKRRNSYGLPFSSENST